MKPACPRMLLATLAAAATVVAQDPTVTSGNGATIDENALTAYYQDGGAVTKTGQAYGTSADDESGVKVTGGGSFTLSDSTVTTSGNTSSMDNSSFYGLNAGVLAEDGSSITLTDVTVTTTGTGANGVFSTGEGSTATLTNVTINCSANGGHGVDATVGGVMTLTNVDITTAGANGAAIATDRGSGAITATGGKVVASGQDSPGIYSTGVIAVTDADISATGAEGAVIEGANSITLTNTALSGAKGTRDRGTLIYQSESGDASGKKGVFTMTGGSFTWPSTTGPAFYITNTTGVITLSGVTLNNSSPTLIKAAADNWGTSGSNGGTVVFTADAQALTGSIVADNISAIAATLRNGSTLTGAINVANTAKSVALTLDASSSWSVTANSYITSLTEATSTLDNIDDNGFTIYYDSTATASAWLEGKTYTLTDGGTLTPIGGSDTYTITASAGNNGSISPSGAVSVASGGSQTFTITPNSGCSIADVLVDSVSAGAIASYTFSNVTANHTIAATFQGSSTTYTITASAGDNGSISPSGAVSVASGGSQTFTIAPNDGYTVADVLVDGVSVGAVTSYTFSDVADDHTIAASFTYLEYHVAQGSYFLIDAATVNKTVFDSKPKKVVAGKGKARILNASKEFKAGVTQLKCEWPGKIAAATYSLYVDGTRVTPTFVVEPAADAVLTPNTGAAEDIIVLSGVYFGANCPKVTIIYTDDNNKTKKIRSEVITPFEFPDARGHANKSVMDVSTGESRLKFAVPKKFPEGAAATVKIEFKNGQTINLAFNAEE